VLAERAAVRGEVFSVNETRKPFFMLSDEKSFLNLAMPAIMPNDGFLLSLISTGVNVRRASSMRVF